MLHQVLLVSNPQPKKTSSKKVTKYLVLFLFFFKSFIDQYPIIPIITLNITITVHMSIQYSKIFKETNSSTLHVFFSFQRGCFLKNCFENIFCYLALYSCNDNYIDYNV